MKLITEVSIPEYPFRIDHSTSLLMMGSCFTDQIGSLLKRYLFPLLVNPFGVTYNPLSVKKGLETLLHKDVYTQGDLDQYNNFWFSFDHDTKFSSPDPQEALDGINREFARGKQMMDRLRFLIITWGTAWVYRYHPTGEIACNCHKIPASQFTRFRLTVREIADAYLTLIGKLQEINNELTILLTVSPVRHWKDGAHGNQLSKSTLLLASEELIRAFPGKVFYFPSYEIVMDELRDYRYYTEDMLHTNPQATRYIWEKFQNALISKTSKAVIRELQPLLGMMDHRPIHPESKASMKMLAQREQKLKELQQQYPHIAWENLDH
jgi:hypothetical protein